MEASNRKWEVLNYTITCEGWASAYMNTEFLSGVRHCAKCITFTDIFNLADTCRRQLLLLSLFWYEAIKAKGKVMCQAQSVRKWQSHYWNPGSLAPRPHSYQIPTPWNDVNSASLLAVRPQAAIPFISLGWILWCRFTESKWTRILDLYPVPRW